MPKSHQIILELLKGELQFLESGGFRHCPRSPWCAPHNFREFPSCPNYSELAGSHLCDECWLMQFVDPDLREEQIPCRFVQLTPSGVTVDSLCRYDTPAQAEETLRCWLHQRIRELEVQREINPFAFDETKASSRKRVTPEDRCNLAPQFVS